jgi:hypothetical protein
MDKLLAKAAHLEVKQRESFSNKGACRQEIYGCMWAATSLAEISFGAQSGCCELQIVNSWPTRLVQISLAAFFML